MKLLAGFLYQAFDVHHIYSLFAFFVALKEDALAIGAEDGRDEGGVGGAVFADGEFAMDGAEEEENEGGSFA